MDFRRSTGRVRQALIAGASFLCGAWMLGVPATARAEIALCVGNIPSLLGALAIGQNSGQAVTIRLEQANYQLDGQMAPIIAFSAPTHLLGGYVPNTNCAQRSVNPSNTIIAFNTASEVWLTQDAGDPAALLEIDGVTLSNAGGMYIAAGLFHPLVSDDDGNISLTRSVITAMANKVTVNADDGNVNLENVRFDHLTTPAATQCAVDIELASDSTLTAQAVTADLAGSKDFCLTANTLESGHAVAYLANSIIWGSDGGIPAIRSVNLDDHPFDIGLSNDLFHTFTGDGPATIQAQVNADPKWANPAAGDYHLLAASPAVNSGTPTVFGGLPSTDIESLPRFRGSAPDRGAYESPFDDRTYLTVSNTNDSGGGSLRQAVLDANTLPIARGIVFNIPGACPHVIALQSVLPPIKYPLNIDGYSQPGATPNDDADAFNANLCVLVKSAGGSLGYGFRVSVGDAAAQLYLHGLGLGGFGQPVILLDGNNHLITGNQFGGAVAGNSLPGAGLFAISIGVNATASLIVGGNAAADRNVIGGAGTAGINIQSGVDSTPDRCQIVNNLIGPTPDGIDATPNFYGVALGGNGCLMLGNRIAGNTSDAVLIQGDGNVLQRNVIGVNVSGGALPNNGAGIRIGSGSGNTIGTGAASTLGGTLLANTIRYMAKGGVLLGANAGTGNSVRTNLIYDNGAVVFDSSVGDGFDLDLDADGPTADHSGNLSGPNNLQNFPFVNRIYWSGYTPPPANSTNIDAIVAGNLSSAAGIYKVDFYYSPRCDNGAFHVLGRGHAAAYLGNTTVAIAGGTTGAAFSKQVTVPGNAANSVVSLTATDANGNTSEIGSCGFISTAVDDGIFKSGFEP
jgi:hypothetical protein